MLCFLDCYSGYHQIALAEEDQIKTSFITYKRAIQNCLQTQIGRNVEAYVDDVVIKTKDSDDLIADLTETVNNLSLFQWKLNPTKCVFGVPAGKLLGFIVSQRGIEANPEKITTILKMEPPKCIKDIQKLTGCMASLNRFISRLGDRG
jgi:hypothetical protein